MSAATISTARLEARISTDLHSMLKRAAELQGRTMTDFVVAAVQDAAQRAIEQAEVVRLSLADQECFAQALLSPPQASPALERAFARRSMPTERSQPASVRAQGFRPGPHSPVPQPASTMSSAQLPAPTALRSASTTSAGAR